MATKIINSLVTTKAVPDEVTAQARLRKAVFSGVSDDDVQAIVANIVERAKKGDAKATQMVFDYLLGGRLGTQVNVQTNVAAAASDPSDTPPGTTDRVRVMRERAARGEEIFSAADRQSA